MDLEGGSYKNQGSLFTTKKKQRVWVCIRSLVLRSLSYSLPEFCSEKKRKNEKMRKTHECHRPYIKHSSRQETKKITGLRCECAKQTGFFAKTEKKVACCKNRDLKSAVKIDVDPEMRSKIN